MNTHHCCQTTTRVGESTRRPASRWRRGSDVAGYIVPGTLLLLVPKCPACVAAYVALATGVGISMSTAAHLRTLMILLCMASLIFVAGKRLRRFTAR
jgi:hypothetical protein